MSYARCSLPSSPMVGSLGLRNRATGSISYLANDERVVGARGVVKTMKTGNPHQARLNPPPGRPADAEGNFLPLPQWLPGQPQPADWPSHIHPPREVESKQ